MLFNSLGFILAFLPLTLAGYYALIRFGFRDWIFLYISVTSLVFYAIGSPRYVPLILASAFANYLFGRWIDRCKAHGQSSTPALVLGVCANLLTLGYFKYANFFVENLNVVAGTDFTLQRVILPLAISFYTFQQIAYLVDIGRGEVKSEGLVRYLSFVLFFPRLVQGPIVHYGEIMPQFQARTPGRFWRSDITIGLVIFAIGLFKKTVIADNMAGFASPVFGAAHSGAGISLMEGWQAAICYTIQLYFDFSGYSDMAVGLARMFGVLLPPNFHSPLRAASIIDYWRRWHITLQHFIVSYMYQPLVLPLARFCALRGFGKWASFAITVALPTVVLFMAIGMWHGPAWTFILFGLMHGCYLAVNEFWRAIRRKARRSKPPGKAALASYHVLTLFCVVVANVMFRAETPHDALAIWKAMFLPASLSSGLGADLLLGAPLAAISILIIALMPNTQQLLARYRPVLYWSRWRDVAQPVLQIAWRPSLGWAIWTGVVLFLGFTFTLREQSVFIYFNF
jgi:D-alanyl-lipoteichoic acid acyltransferase DltB (MBOAT superfamily)